MKNRESDNMMKNLKVSSLIWKMGLPMVVSMVMQALYNIVDTAFVINMGEEGINANLALTYAFPVQIFMIAVGVGTGIGINALLSKSLGEGNREKASRTVGNGLFIGVIIYLVFLLFGIFGSESFIRMQADGNEESISFGKEYLTIVCTLSFSQVGYTVYERFLLATGKTMLSTIGQVSGAITNIVLDYVFIYPLEMGVKGAAYATVIGQTVSFLLNLFFHYFLNKEVSNKVKDIKPDRETILGILKLGIPAMIMQALLSVMMLGVNLILGVSSYDRDLLTGSFGIYYKIQQIPLFAAFGMSNALISVVSFNFGLGEKERVKESFKWGVIDTIIVSLIFAVVFEILAKPIADIFGLASGSSSAEIIDTVTFDIRIASIGFIFMGISVSLQGVLQGLRYVILPVIISLLRLAIFIFPIVFLFTLSENARYLIWFTFPLSEILTSLFSFLISKREVERKLSVLKTEKTEISNL